MAQDPIYDDLLEGFPCEESRLKDARTNLDYYRGEFSRYWSRPRNAPTPIQRTTLFTKFVVDYICNLYSDVPLRSVVGSPEATAWLQQVYSYTKLFAKWQQAERLSCLSQASAFQVSGTEDPRKPLKITLWSADSFVTYTDPDDPTEPRAVVTVDCYQGRKRWQVWEPDRYRVFLGKSDQSVGPEQAVQVTDKANPYGILPFSFAHWNYPTLDFWSGSPGTNLRQANAYLNERLSDIAGGVVYSCNPIVLVENSKPEYVPPNPEPGLWLKVPSDVDTNGTELGVRISYLQPDYGFVQSAWLDLENFVNHTLETNGVPEAAVRMSQSVARSGVSIAMEQMPLSLRAHQRKAQWRHYEQDLANVVVQVANAHFKANDVSEPLIRLLAELGFDLSVTYKETYSATPGPERDRSQQWEVDNGYKSKLMVFQERTGCTREEALAHFAQVNEDLEQLAALDALPETEAEKQEDTQEAMEVSGEDPSMMEDANDGTEEE